MVDQLPHRCACARCRGPGENGTKELHAELNLFLSTLDREKRLQFLGLESINPARGGDQELELITGVSATAIAKTRWQIEYSWLAERRSRYWLQSIHAREKEALFRPGLAGEYKKAKKRYG